PCTNGSAWRGRPDLVERSDKWAAVAGDGYRGPQIALDVESLEANRRGRLSDSQMRLVRREMVGWLLNGMGTAAFGLLVVMALPAWLPFVFWLPVVVTAGYMAFRGYDCCCD